MKSQASKPAPQPGFILGDNVGRRTGMAIAPDALPDMNGVLDFSVFSSAIRPQSAATGSTAHATAAPNKGPSLLADQSFRIDSDDERDGYDTHVDGEGEATHVSPRCQDGEGFEHDGHDFAADSTNDSHESDHDQDNADDSRSVYSSDASFLTPSTNRVTPAHNQDQQSCAESVPLTSSPIARRLSGFDQQQTVSHRHIAETPAPRAPFPSTPRAQASQPTLEDQPSLTYHNSLDDDTSSATNRSPSPDLLSRPTAGAVRSGQATLTAIVSSPRFSSFSASASAFRAPSYTPAGQLLASHLHSNMEPVGFQAGTDTLAEQGTHTSTNHASVTALNMSMASSHIDLQPGDNQALVGTINDDGSPSHDPTTEQPGPLVTRPSSPSKLLQSPPSPPEFRDMQSETSSGRQAEHSAASSRASLSKILAGFQVATAINLATPLRDTAVSSVTRRQNKVDDLLVPSPHASSPGSSMLGEPPTAPRGTTQDKIEHLRQTLRQSVAPRDEFETSHSRKTFNDDNIPPTERARPVLQSKHLQEAQARARVRAQHKAQEAKAEQLSNAPRRQLEPTELLPPTNVNGESHHIDHAEPRNRRPTLPLPVSSSSEQKAAPTLPEEEDLPPVRMHQRVRLPETPRDQHRPRYTPAPVHHDQVDAFQRDDLDHKPRHDSGSEQCLSEHDNDETEGFDSSAPPAPSVQGRFAASRGASRRAVRIASPSPVSQSPEPLDHQSPRDFDADEHVNMMEQDVRVPAAAALDTFRADFGAEPESYGMDDSFLAGTGAPGNTDSMDDPDGFDTAMDRPSGDQGYLDERQEHDEYVAPEQPKEPAEPEGHGEHEEPEEPEEPEEKSVAQSSRRKGKAATTRRKKASTKKSTGDIPPAPSSTAGKKPVGSKTESAPSTRKRSREVYEPLEPPPELDRNGRPKRNRTAPLEWWRGERKEYVASRLSSGVVVPHVTGVVRKRDVSDDDDEEDRREVASASKKANSGKRKAPAKSTGKTKKQKVVDEPEETVDPMEVQVQEHETYDSAPTKAKSKGKSKAAGSRRKQTDLDPQPDHEQEQEQQLYQDYDAPMELDDQYQYYDARASSSTSQHLAPRAEEPEPEPLPHQQELAPEVDDEPDLPDVEAYDVSTSSTQQLPLRWKSSMFKLQPVKGDPLFRVHNLFSLNNFVVGVLSLSPNGIKPNRSTRENCMTFTVVSGTVEVMIHNNKFDHAEGDIFIIPPKNQYKIENKGAKEAVLYFTSGKAFDPPKPSEDRCVS